jgi:hypothetical protein
MKIDSKKFALRIREDEVPHWTCPHCDVVTLILRKDQLKVIETGDSLRNQNDDNWSPDWNEGIFVAKLQCPNPHCEEPIYFSGNAALDYAYHDDPPRGEDIPIGGFPVYKWFLNIKYFSKSIKLFPLHKYYPKKVTEMLNKAFGLLWSDSASCANKIRSVVELILDNLKVKKNGKSKMNAAGKSKRVPMTLSNRITTLRQDKPKFSAACDKLDAVRWIGNTGSHGDDEKLERDDLLEAFDFLESAIDIIYNPHPKRQERRVKKIIKKKGPVKRRTAYKR